MLKKIFLFTAVLLIALLYNCNNLNIHRSHIVFNNDKIENAYNILLNAKEFSTGPVGYGASIPEYIKAYAVIFKDINARDLFISLSKEATIEGKLYSFCALYYLDNDYFDKVVKEYNSSNKMVSRLEGCILTEEKLSQIIYDIYRGGAPSRLKRYLKSYEIHDKGYIK